MVDESELWELFTRMRRVLWDVPHAKGSIDYTRVVQEFPPLGSKFNPQGAYTTPDGVLVTRPMRMRVMEYKKEYATEGQEQRERLSHLNKPQVYVTEQRVSVIPEEYGEGPLYERKRPMTLQERPPTPHVQAGTSAVLQRDPRMTSGYTVKPVGLDLPQHTFKEVNFAGDQYSMTVSNKDNKSEYTVKRLLDSQNLGPKDRPGLHRPIIPAHMPQPRDAGN